MKALIIASGVILGIFFGFFPGIDKKKPFLWKLLAVLFMTLLILLTFIPPIAANFFTARYLANAYDNYEGNLAFQISKIEKNTEDKWIITITENAKSTKLQINTATLPDEFKVGNKLVIKSTYDKQNNEFIYKSTVAVNPLFTFPVVPGLEEQIRIMNFHVPVAWISVLAYFFAMFFAIRYLQTRNIDYDIKAAVAAEIGTIFTILATVTGMIWAKFNWGSFWNWDPRETAIFLLLLIYGAYFALRSAIENEELRAKLSSLYSILAFVTVPFLVFVLPRILEGLHPGSQNDTTAGPVISSAKDSLNYLQQFTFSLGFIAFSMLFFWVYNLKLRLKKIEYKI